MKERLDQHFSRPGSMEGDDKEFCNFTIAILKPDVGRDVLTPCLIDEIERQGGIIIKRKEMKISRIQAEDIYKEYAGTPKFEPAVQSIVCEGERDYCTVMVVTHPNERAIDFLQRIKGKALKSGIRKNFLVDRIPALRAKGASEEEIEKELAKNRLHSPDKKEDVIREIWLLFNEMKLGEMKDKFPEFPLNL